MGTNNETDETDETRLLGPVVMTVPKSSITLADPWTDVSVLSMDGGGVRGYLSLLILQRLMEIVGQVERREWEVGRAANGEECHNSSFYYNHKRYGGYKGHGKFLDQTSRERIEENVFLPCHYFDYTFGTSTGGLNVLMLSRLRMSVDDCVRDYPTLASNIFCGGISRTLSIHGLARNRFDPTRLEEEVKAMVSKNTPRGLHSERRKRCERMEAPKDLCKTAVLTNARHPEFRRSFLSILRSYPHEHNSTTSSKGNITKSMGPASTSHIWEVARAAAAAPTIFPPIMIDEVLHFDAGLRYNNPASVAVAEARSREQTIHASERLEPVILTSVGTGVDGQGQGHVLRKTGIRRVDNVVGEMSGKAVEFVDAATDTEVTHTDVETLMKATGRPYFRFGGGTNIGGLRMDEWNGAVERKIRQLAKEYLEDPTVSEDMLSCAKLLVAQRRERQEHDFHRWKRFTFCVRYICPFCATDKYDDDAFDLYSHMLRRHVVEMNAIPNDAEVWRLIEENAQHPTWKYGPY